MPKVEFQLGGNTAFKSHLPSPILLLPVIHKEIPQMNFDSWYSRLDEVLLIADITFQNNEFNYAK